MINKERFVLDIIISSGKNQKEILSESEEITIGRDIENTIPLNTKGIPESFLLFKKDKENYHLYINKLVKQAHITLYQTTFSVYDLIQHGLLPKRDKNTYYYTVRPNCSGTIYIKDIECSFSYKKAPPLPPPPPPPVIPREYRRKLISKEDLGFFKIFFISVILHTWAAYMFEATVLPDRDITNIRKVPKRFAKLILGVTSKELKEINKPKIKKAKKEKPKKEKPKKEEKKKEEPKKEKPKKEELKKKVEKEVVKVVEKSKPKEKVEKKQISLEQKRARVRAKRREKLKTKGVLAILAGKKSFGSGKRKVSHFIENKELSQDIDKVLTNLGGLQKVRKKGKKVIRKEESANIDSLIADVAKKERENIKVIKLKKRKRANIEDIFGLSGSAARNPKRSKEVIAGVVQTYKRALKYLYDRELRKDPTLEGKVVVKFTILANGKITGCTTVSSTMGNKRFENSVIKRIRRWKFEAIDEGEVEITYPFIFFPVITG